MSTLLEKARKAPRPGRRVTPPNREELDLLVAYFKGEVSAAQVAIAIGTTRQGSSTWVSVGLRNAVIKGLIKLTVRP